jgi:hypothetical protein
MSLIAEAAPTKQKQTQGANSQALSGIGKTFHIVWRKISSEWQNRILRSGSNFF